MCKRRTIIVVFQQAHFSSAGTLVRGSFHYFLAKDLSIDSKQGRGLRNMTGWYPSILFFLSEPFPHTSHGCLPERLLYYSSTLLPTCLHTLYILFDLCPMLLCSLKHSSAPFNAPPILPIAHPVHVGNMTLPTCAHVSSTSKYVHLITETQHTAPDWEIQHITLWFVGLIKVSVLLDFSCARVGHVKQPRSCGD